jgi:uncharacterized protein
MSIATAITGKKPELKEFNVSELVKVLEYAIKFAKSINPEDYKTEDGTLVDMPSWMPNKKMVLDEYVGYFSTTNLNFHVIISYAILRSIGMDIGKNDFTRDLNIIEQN